jgi:hypothetical protein
MGWKFGIERVQYELEHCSILDLGQMAQAASLRSHAM